MAPRTDANPRQEYSTDRDMDEQISNQSQRHWFFLRIRILISTDGTMKGCRSETTLYDETIGRTISTINTKKQNITIFFFVRITQSAHL